MYRARRKKLGNNTERTQFIVPLQHLQPIVIPSKEGTQHISTFFSYQKEQLKQGLQTLSEKI